MWTISQVLPGFHTTCRPPPCTVASLHLSFAARSSTLGSSGQASAHCRTCQCRTATLDELQTATNQYVWEGHDEYDALDDRRDEPPKALPGLKGPKRVVLVRHGQSTWNAEGRVQGSCNLSVLTEKGKAQAHTTKELLHNERFDVLYKSPLARAVETAEIIWGDRRGQVKESPHLREIDLYSFQGLLKHEGKERFGQQFKKWQKQASQFELDNHAPIRELWYRASVAWQDILTCKGSTILVVAHNAVNQALVCTALGMPPEFFRKLLQSNGATTVLDIQPESRNESTPPVIVDRLNQSPGPPFGAEPTGGARIVLVRCGETEGSEQGRLTGVHDYPLSPLGDVHGNKAGEFLMDLRVSKVLASPLQRAQHTAKLITTYQQLSGSRRPEIETLDSLNNRDWGEWEGKFTTELQGQPIDASVEGLESFYNRVGEAWAAVRETCFSGDAHTDGGHSVVTVTHGSVIACILCHCLGLGPEALPLWRADAGGITVIDFPDLNEPSRVTVRCTNYTAHLGRWSVPITPNEELEGVCGIDGCF